MKTQVTMKQWLIALVAMIMFGSPQVSMAASAYDGAWDLIFVTRTGACDPTYNFGVNIKEGFISHPNLVRFQGKVARSGQVRASVTVQDKYASGVGRTLKQFWTRYMDGSVRRVAMRRLLDCTKELIT